VAAAEAERDAVAAQERKLAADAARLQQQLGSATEDTFTLQAGATGKHPLYRLAPSCKLAKPPRRLSRPRHVPGLPQPSHIARPLPRSARRPQKQLSGAIKRIDALQSEKNAAEEAVAEAVARAEEVQVQGHAAVVGAGG
jgi:hypothetical protein